jgi:hypothetical protein
LLTRNFTFGSKAIKILIKYLAMAINDDQAQKQKIDSIKQKHLGRLSQLKVRRDKIISDFTDILKQKKLDEIKKSIQRP